MPSSSADQTQNRVSMSSVERRMGMRHINCSTTFVLLFVPRSSSICETHDGSPVSARRRWARRVRMSG